MSPVTPDRCCRDCQTPLRRRESLRKLLCAECNWEATNRRLLTTERRAAVIAAKRQLGAKTTGTAPVKEGNNHE